MSNLLHQTYHILQQMFNCLQLLMLKNKYKLKVIREDLRGPPTKYPF